MGVLQDSYSYGFCSLCYLTVASGSMEGQIFTGRRNGNDGRWSQYWSHIGGGRDQILATINPLGHPIFVQAQLSGLFLFRSVALSTHIISTPYRPPFEDGCNVGSRREPTAKLMKLMQLTRFVFICMVNGDLYLL